MFERFTDDARRVLVRAQEVTSELRSPYIRRHHLLISVIDTAGDDDAVSAVFADAGIDRTDLRARLVSSVTATEAALDEPRTKPDFTAEAKKALELSLREALRLGHNYISGLHLMLGILRGADGPLADVLKETGLTRDNVGRVLGPAVGRARGRRGRPQAAVRPLLRRSTPGLRSVMRRAEERAGNDRNATTGDLLVALLETPGTHFAAALSSVTLPDMATVAAEADRLVAEGVVDGTQDAVRVDPDSGSVTINDPQIAAEVKRLVGEGAATPDALREILRRLQSED